MHLLSLQRVTFVKISTPNETSPASILNPTPIYDIIGVAGILTTKF